MREGARAFVGVTPAFPEILPPVNLALLFFHGHYRRPRKQCSKCRITFLFLRVAVQSYSAETLKLAEGAYELTR